MQARAGILSARHVTAFLTVTASKAAALYCSALTVLCCAVPVAAVGVHKSGRCTDIQQNQKHYTSPSQRLASNFRISLCPGKIRQRLCGEFVDHDKINKRKAMTKAAVRILSKGAACMTCTALDNKQLVLLFVEMHCAAAILQQGQSTDAGYLIG